MRQPPLLLVCFIAILTGVTAGLLANTGTTTPTRIEARSTADPSIVEKFYAEVNAMLRGGDGAGLETIIAPDLIEHPFNHHRESGKAGFIQSIQDLRIYYPDMQLILREIDVVGDTVMVQVSVEGEVSNSVLGIPLEPTMAWSAIDLFRIARGRITERWSSPQLVWASPELSGQLTIANPAWRRLELSRVSLPPGKSTAVSFDEPALIISELGLAGVSLDRHCAESTLLVHPAIHGAKQRPYSVEPGGIVTMVPGDMLEAPAGGCVTLHNGEPESIQVLILSVPVPAIPGGPVVVDQSESDANPSAPITLAGGVALTVPLGEAVVRAAHLKLRPGSYLPDHTNSGLVMIIVKRGTLSISVSGDSAWFRKNGLNSVRRLDAAVLAEGASAVVPANARVSYHAQGTEPVELLIVTITEGPTATSGA